MNQDISRHAIHRVSHECDVCVVGGGMAGLCAAIASARRGAKTVLVHDRPVLGGNASSEVRMWICGAHGPFNKETGILEEIQLDNALLNAPGNYSIWDSVLWAKATYQPNLTLLLNCSCTDAEVDDASGDRRIVNISAWQLTTQTWHTVHAKVFIDSSGDSILAPLTGAQCRWGRESRHEFDEDIQPDVADDKTMGNSLLIQLRRTDESQPFIAPRWAYKFEKQQDIPFRINGVNGGNFWWIELGGLADTIRDGERIRDELTRVVYGVWDYIKNKAPERAKAETWALEWMGMLPGKRENRRYVGDHVLTQNDVRAQGRFDDLIAYGGWSMDDHHPAGLFYPGKPTIFHPAPSPYGIPYRSLYSRNVSNLMCAGRNISVTHAALSSTRVMGTCAIIGQAAGTAAAMCSMHHCDPRSLAGGERLGQLQRTLMEDDCFLPWNTRAVDDVAKRATLHGSDASVEHVRDGHDRDRENQPHTYVGPLGQGVVYQWPEPTQIAGVRLVFDSDLKDEKRLPCNYPRKSASTAMPATLVKSFCIEAMSEAGQWEIISRVSDNHQRVVRVAVNRQTRGIRLVPETTWGDDLARVTSFEPTRVHENVVPEPPQGPTFAEVRSRIPADDLAEPPTPAQQPNRKGFGA